MALSRSARPRSSRALGLLGLATLAVVATACASRRPAVDASLGQTYYTRFGVLVDGNNVRSTNYRVTTGSLLPINTPVEYASTRGKYLVLSIAGGNSFEFEHVPRHTQDTFDEAFDTFFSTEPTDLSGFSAAERASIEEAQVELGMSRDAVLAAIGPPPASGTLLLDGKVWKYWKNRFDTYEIWFDDSGAVSKVVD